MAVRRIDPRLTHLALAVVLVAAAVILAPPSPARSSGSVVTCRGLTSREWLWLSGSAG